MSLLSKAKDLLGQRQRAYFNVFNPEQQFSEIVLRDLAKFCRANETCFHTDQRLHAVLEGRREVWLRIQQHLKLSPDQLAELYKVKE